METVVDVSDMKVSTSPEDILVANCLGSCIGITLYDPEIHVGGILHFMLPSSLKIDIKTDGFPYMFADKAIPAFFNAVVSQGAQKERLKIVAAGGSQVLLQDVHLNVGKENVENTRKIFKGIGLKIDFEDFGGNNNRNIKLNNQTGETLIEIIGRRVIKV